MDVESRVEEEEDSQEDEAPLLKEITDRIAFFLDALVLRECMNDYTVINSWSIVKYYEKTKAKGFLKSHFQPSREEKDREIPIRSWHYDLEKKGLNFKTTRIDEVWLNCKDKYTITLCYWILGHIGIMLLSKNIDEDIIEKHACLMRLAFNK